MPTEKPSRFEPGLYILSNLLALAVLALPSLKAYMPNTVFIQPFPFPVRSLLVHEPPRCMYGTSFSGISPVRTLAGSTGNRCSASPLSCARMKLAIDLLSKPRAPPAPKFFFFLASASCDAGLTVGREAGYRRDVANRPAAPIF